MSKTGLKAAAKLSLERVKKEYDDITYSQTRISRKSKEERKKEIRNIKSERNLSYKFALRCSPEVYCH